MTLREHHSFVELPDLKYKPRKLDPRAPSFGIEFYDYASPITEPVEKRWIARHRLEKKDPSAAISEPVEPIVYYVDNGAPEPIRTALVEGASWWNQAFEAAGFRNAFQVKVLPADADPMDVRYNMINWVHRSTRGWSYGGGITDPRTGEIIKGNVTLGSLRVRQDFMIGSGLIPQYAEGDDPRACLADMSPEPDYLAALDDSTDSVGDVAGAHPPARGARDRPHAGLRAQLRREHLRPRLGDGLSGAVGRDQGRQARSVERLRDRHRRIRQVRRPVRLLAVPRRRQRGAGARDRSSKTASPTACSTSPTRTRVRPNAAHPLASLWDNGADPIATLEHEMEVRRIGLSQFGLTSIPVGTPLSELELKLLPLYLHHRYQLLAAVKSLGGVYFTYAVRTPGGPNPPVVAEIVPPAKQKAALAAVLDTLSVDALRIPERILSLIPPTAFGYGGGTAEPFDRRTNPTFDPIGAATIAADVAVSALLQPQRAARVNEHASRNAENPSLQRCGDVAGDQDVGCAARRGRLRPGDSRRGPEPDGHTADGSRRRPQRLGRRAGVGNRGTALGDEDCEADRQRPHAADA